MRLENGRISHLNEVQGILRKLVNCFTTKSNASLAQKGFIATILTSLLILSGCGSESEYDYTGPGLEIVKENPDTAPWFNVYRPADMVAAVEEKGHLLPVVVWANGGCFRSDFTWQPLFKRWAAEGYVVLALTASDSAGSLSQTTAKQQGELIDWALGQSEFVDMLDAEKVVAAGNSCGGVTALQLTAQDPRVASVFVLSGSSAVGSSDTDVMDAITVPVGFVVGGPSDIAGANAISDYEALAAEHPAMIVNRFEADHQTVSTEVPILEEVADISLAWMNLSLYGLESAYTELTSADVCSDCTPDHWTLTSKNLETLIE